MDFIKNLSLKFKLLFIAIPSLVIVVIYSILFILNLIGEKSNLETNKNKIKEAEVLSKVIHSMQIEIANHMINGYKELNENIQQTINLISGILSLFLTPLLLTKLTLNPLSICME